MTQTKQHKNTSWQPKKLGEICKVIAGQSPEGKHYNKLGNGLPFYQGKKEFTGKHIGSPSTWTAEITKEARIGDILMSVRAPVGPVNFATERICIGRGLAAIRAGKEIDKEFLFNFLCMHENKIVGNVGAVFSSINKAQIAAIEISLPPLPEQKRIVKKLDKVFEAIAKAKENAEKNLQNNRELFESYLNNIFANPGKGWEEKRLGEICDLFNGFAFKSKDAVISSNTQLIRMGNLYKNKLNLDRRPSYYPDRYANIYKKYLLQEGDLIISLTGTVGKKDYGYTVAIPETEKKLLLNQRIAKIVLLNKAIIKDYFFYYLLSRVFLDVLYRTARGTRQANLSSSNMKKIAIPLPGKIEQKRVVAKLDALSTKTKKLEAIYQNKLTDLEELKKSVLQKAFSAGGG